MASAQVSPEPPRLGSRQADGRSAAASRRLRLRSAAARLGRPALVHAPTRETLASPWRRRSLASGGRDARQSSEAATRPAGRLTAARRGKRCPSILPFVRSATERVLGKGSRYVRWAAGLLQQTREATV